MIIDFHTHIFSPKVIANRADYIIRDPLFALLYSSPKAKFATAEDLIAEMDLTGINKSVVLNINWSTQDICHETNDYIMESVSRYSDRLIGFGTLVFNSIEKALKEIEHCIQGKAKGIGEIRPAPDLLTNITYFKSVFQLMMEKRLILLTHTSEPVGHNYPGKGDITPGILYPLITEYPELTIVCSHWGGGLPFYSLMPEVKQSLSNVYFDSAASPFLYSPMIYNQVYQIAGADKILFGSDYPLLSPKRLLNEIDSCNLPPNVKDMILCGNAEKLLSITNSGNM